eukprot:8704607-Ditylum_brightwellii.AAC.1
MMSLTQRLWQQSEALYSLGEVTSHALDGMNMPWGLSLQEVDTKDHTRAHNIIAAKVVRVDVTRVVSDVVKHSVIIFDGVHAEVGVDCEGNGDKGWIVSLIVLLCGKGFGEGVTHGDFVW